MLSIIILLYYKNILNKIFSIREVTFMNNRENFMSTIKRKGYEHMPVNFMLCHSLVNKYHAIEKSNLSYQEYFGMIDYSIGSQSPIDSNLDDFKKYYSFDLKPGTTIDCWGVANEPGSEAAMHMTHMLHPLSNCDSLDQLKEYSFPSFAKGLPQSLEHVSTTYIIKILLL